MKDRVSVTGYSVFLFYRVAANSVVIAILDYISEENFFDSFNGDYS